MVLKTKNYWITLLALPILLLSSCKDDDAPPAEDEEEVIDLVRLTFTPTGGGATVVFEAKDPDGEGAADFKVEDVFLKANTSYKLAVTLENTTEKEDVTEEIKEKKDDHMFFFEFTNDLFANPKGNGNVDKREDGAINYNDEDGNKYPVGLSTTWETGDASDGTFRVILKHQPNIKSATSTATDGESDIDISWKISIQ